ncbi:collagen alpha-1(I) chain-like [Dromiciops gliroides]|uniref:collagen alpha-1(I) chain-like n=1 Tax=Dromiciops gliroides TaxID=33562 RepID=UPI001CC73B8D|nr:collagen alpha-1(I) chain-like [Dromiciops gliroides]
MYVCVRMLRSVRAHALYMYVHALCVCVCMRMLRSVRAHALYMYVNALCMCVYVRMLCSVRAGYVYVRMLCSSPRLGPKRLILAVGVGQAGRPELAWRGYRPEGPGPLAPDPPSSPPTSQPSDLRALGKGHPTSSMGSWTLPAGWQGALTPGQPQARGQKMPLGGHALPGLAPKGKTALSQGPTRAARQLGYRRKGEGRGEGERSRHMGVESPAPYSAKTLPVRSPAQPRAGQTDGGRMDNRKEGRSLPRGLLGGLAGQILPPHGDGASLALPPYPGRRFWVSSWIPGSSSRQPPSEARAHFLLKCPRGAGAAQPTPGLRPGSRRGTGDFPPPPGPRPGGGRVRPGGAATPPAPCGLSPAAAGAGGLSVWTFQENGSGGGGGGLSCTPPPPRFLVSAVVSSRGTSRDLLPPAPHPPLGLSGSFSPALSFCGSLAPFSPSLPPISLLSPSWLGSLAVAMESSARRTLAPSCQVARSLAAPPPTEPRPALTQASRALASAQLGRWQTMTPPRHHHDRLLVLAVLPSGEPGRAVPGRGWEGGPALRPSPSLGRRGCRCRRRRRRRSLLRSSTQGQPRVGPPACSHLIAQPRRRERARADGGEDARIRESPRARPGPPPLPAPPLRAPPRPAAPRTSPGPPRPARPAEPRRAGPGWAGQGRAGQGRADPAPAAVLGGRRSPRAAAAASGAERPEGGWVEAEGGAPPPPPGNPGRPWRPAGEPPLGEGAASPWAPLLSPRPRPDAASAPPGPWALGGPRTPSLPQLPVGRRGRSSGPAPEHEPSRGRHEQRRAAPQRESRAADSGSSGPGGLAGEPEKAVFKEESMLGLFHLTGLGWKEQARLEPTVLRGALGVSQPLCRACELLPPRVPSCPSESFNAYSGGPSKVVNAGFLEPGPSTLSSPHPWSPGTIGAIWLGFFKSPAIFGPSVTLL